MNDNRKTLIIRADGGVDIGTGHLMRCLALAQAWQDRGGEAIFVTACDSGPLKQRLQNEEFRIIEIGKTYPDPEDWKITKAVLGTNPDSWVVLDGYHFDPAYQKMIQEEGNPLLVIDDMAHQDHYYADIVLNQNIYAEKLNYPCDPEPRLLLGKDYVLLRREFWSWRKWEREIPEVGRKVMITMGGSDPKNQTLNALQALQKVEVENLEVAVVVGASNPHYDQIESAVEKLSVDIQIIQNTSDMPKLMKWADVALTAGGSTCWEMAYMGLPMVVMTLAENQRGISVGLAEHGAALNLGWYLDINQKMISEALTEILMNCSQRKEMSAKGQDLIDGAGSRRVVNKLGLEKSENRLQARYACWDDLELLYRWANDPAVRKNSFNQAPISMDDHMKWYRKKLTSSCTLLLIIEYDKEPVAQIRYERDENDIAEINFSVDRDHRGKGIGTKVLDLTEEVACEKLCVKWIRGLVISSNEASRRVFMKSGYKDTGEMVVAGELCRVYLKACSEKSGGLE